jgi:hypothetical protein
MSTSATLWRTTSRTLEMLPIAASPVSRMVIAQTYAARANHVLRAATKPVLLRKVRSFCAF